MTTSLKKLLLISITLLLGVMSGGVKAQTTNYDFSFTGDTVYSSCNVLPYYNTNVPNSGSVSGQLTTTNGVVTSISGWVTNYPSTAYAPAGPLLTQAITGVGTINTSGVDGVDHWTNTSDNIITSAAPHLTSLGIDFTTATATYFLYYAPGSYALTGGYVYELDSSLLPFVPEATVVGKSSSFVLTCTSGCSSGGAPEIDGSLAPKVGFLLGCLFLMFGRKKQDLEPMMIS